VSRDLRRCLRGSDDGVAAVEAPQPSAGRAAASTSRRRGYAGSSRTRMVVASARSPILPWRPPLLTSMPAAVDQSRTLWLAWCHLRCHLVAAGERSARRHDGVIAKSRQ
jgi:hypothetical protein